MINIKPVKGKFFVSFNGDKADFNTYINGIMSFPKKDYNYETQSWVFDNKEIEKVKSLFGFSTPAPAIDKAGPTKTNAIVGSKAIIQGYENIGSEMKLSPYSYQKEAIKFCMEEKEALIVYPCGAGKTAIGIGLYLEYKNQGLVNTPGMIVVKASLKDQWHSEIKKFSDLTPVILQTEADVTSSQMGRIRSRKAKIAKLRSANEKDPEIAKILKEIIDLTKEKDEAFKAQFDNADLYVLNYETLKDAKVRETLHKKKLEFILADEVHYVKNRKSGRSKVLSEFSSYVPYKVGATATPVGRDPEDLFGIFQFLKPGLFKNWTTFQKQFVTLDRYRQPMGFKNLEELREKIQPSIIVKSKEDISGQLPSLLVMQRYCGLTKQQSAVHSDIMAIIDHYREEEKMLRAKLKNEANPKSHPEMQKIEGMIMAHQSFAQQMANTEDLLLGSSSEMAKKFVTGSSSNKMDLLMQLLEEILGAEEKVVIFSRFRRMQDIITKRVEKEYPKDTPGIAYINGSLSSKARYEEVYAKFRDNDDYKILLASDAGAEGLNLSKCKYLIEFDLAESFAIQTQRHGRIERADSTHETVFVYQLIANNSWDEVAQKIIEKKENYDNELIRD